jgi:crotonobetainyl-CoA:carnitine CoA-transferase CaiB-like acyl-CoA transferase
MRIEVDHSKLGRIPLTGNPIKVQGAAEREGGPHEAPPVLGEDTETVLAERLGIEEETLRSMRARGVFGR